MIFTALGFISSTKGLFVAPATEALGINRSAFSLGDSCRYIATAVVNMFFGYLVAHFGTKKLIGTGGVLCSMFATALAKTGAKVALLDLNEETAKEYAGKINKDGGIAKGYACNVLDKESIEKAHEEIVKDFGTCDILINGAGGNNPKATTDNEYFTPEAMGNIAEYKLQSRGIDK